MCCVHGGMAGSAHQTSIICSVHPFSWMTMNRGRERKLALPYLSITTGSLWATFQRTGTGTSCSKSSPSTHVRVWGGKGRWLVLWQFLKIESSIAILSTSSWNEDLWIGKDSVSIPISVQITDKLVKTAEESESQFLRIWNRQSSNPLPSLRGPCSKAREHLSQTVIQPSM